MATCSDCSANPGASTTARYCPSARLGKVAVPSPAVVCTPTPALLLARNRLTCTPETRSPDGLCMDTLRSDARAAVQHSSAASNARTMNMTLLLCTRKGLVTVRAGLLACELRFASRTAAGPSRLHSGLAPKTRLQLRGSAGVSPASQFRRIRRNARTLVGKKQPEPKSSRITTRL